MRAALLVCVCTVSLAGWAATGTPSSAREVGDDYQLDYVHARGAVLQVAGPVGASVEIFEGLKTVAQGTAPVTYQAPTAGVFIVSLRTAARKSWEMHVATRDGMRAVLHAWPGRVRTRLSVVNSGNAAKPLAPAAFSSLASELAQKAPLQRFAALQAAAGSARFSALQASELLDAFPEAHERLRVLGWVRRRLVDPDNAIGLTGRFTLLADRRKAQGVVGN